MKTPAIKFDGVYFKYSRRNKATADWVLEDVSFRVDSGETFGVIGRNGSGKSTVLKLMAGIVAPNSGHIDTYGTNPMKLSLSAGFAPLLSGHVNSVLKCMLLGLSKREALERIDAIREFSELGSKFEDPISTYSTGMRARLGFSLALQSPSRSILIDEVLGVGDARFREKAVAALEKLVSDEGRTVVVVSHFGKSIREMCERAIWIDRGKLRAHGPASEIVAAYGDVKQSPGGQT